MVCNMNPLEHHIAFGPIPSRRLGRSLGVNHITAKVCSYACRYCQVGPTTELRIESPHSRSPSSVTSRARPRSGDQAERSGLGFDGDVGVEARGFALDVMIHERLPFVVEGDTTEVQQRLRTG